MISDKKKNMSDDDNSPNETITKPSSIDDFYVQYPNALEVFFDEDGANIYLAQFRAAALASAKQNQKRLFQTGNAPFVQRIYPTSFLYSIAYSNDAGDIVNVFTGGESVAPLTMDVAGLSSAIDDVLQAAGILAQSAEVTETNNGFDIRVISSSDIIIELEDEDGGTFLLTQNFL